MINQSKGTGKSIYRRGADDGLWFGIYLSVLFVVMVNSVYSVLAAVATLGMVIAVPFIVYFYLKRSYRADNCRTLLSGLWLHGICIFFFGSLLMALTAYLYLRFYDPSYMNDVIEMGRQVYAAIDTPDAEEMESVLRQIQEQHLVPGAAETAVQLIWSGVFSGSLLSLVLSLIIRAAVRPMQPPTPPSFQQS